MPHVIDRVDGPGLATRFTLALVEPKLEEHGIDAAGRLVAVTPRQRVAVGPLTLEFLRMTHSMPDCVAVAIHTPAGVIVHTGDFKIDQTPLDGEHCDLHRLAELGSAGVLALFSDSTNADRRGFTGSERDVVDGFEEIFSSADGKSRRHDLLDVDLPPATARRSGRAVRPEARVRRPGHAAEFADGPAARRAHRSPPGVQIRDSEVGDYPAQDVVCVCTGSQGEALAALPRIAIDDHRHVRLAPGDVVAFSARNIPGNEKAIGRVMNHVARRGAEVVTDADRHIHVSGHGSAEELKLVLSLVKPRVFVPIHGEYRQLARHARMARTVCPEAAVVMVQDGDVLRFDDEGARVVDRLAAGPGAHRRHPDGRNRRRGPAGPPPRGRRRPGRGHRRHQRPDAAPSNRRPSIITRGLAADVRHEAMLQGGAGDPRARDRSRAARRAVGPGPAQGAHPGRDAAAVSEAGGTPAAVLPVVMEV